MLILIADMFLDQYYSPDYYAWFRQRGLAGLLSAFYMGSGLVIPLFVALEFIWMKNIESERRALTIDALIAIGYVAVWIIVVVYVGTHTAWL